MFGIIQKANSVLKGFMLLTALLLITLKIIKNDIILK